MQENQSENLESVFEPTLVQEESTDAKISKLKEKISLSRKGLRNVSFLILFLSITFGLPCTDLIWPERIIQTKVANICYDVDTWKGHIGISYLYLFLPVSKGKIQVGKFLVSDTRKDVDKSTIKDTEYNPFITPFIQAGGSFYKGSCVTLSKIDITVEYKKIYMSTFFLPENIPTKIWVNGQTIPNVEMDNHLSVARSSAVLIFILPLFLLLSVIKMLRSSKKELQRIINT